MTPASSDRTESDPPTTNWRAMVLAASLSVLSALGYVLLQNGASHEFDVYWMLPRIESGSLENPQHPLSFFLARTMADALDGCGSLHDRLKIASGLCVGVSVGIFAHTAWLLGRSLVLALWVALIYAALPSTVRFATVMELHGLFLPFAAVVLWLAAAMSARRPSWLVGLLLGFCSAVATSVHSTGHLLVGFVALWLLLAWFRAGVPRLRLGVTLAAVVVAHVLGTLLIAWLAVPAGGDAATAQLDVLVADEPTWRGLWQTVVGEWLWPYLPLSVLWLRGLWPRPCPLAIAFSVSLLVYLAACQLLLTRPAPGYIFREFGAYQLPIAFAAVVICVRALGHRMRGLLLLGTLSLSAYHWFWPEKPPADPEFAQVAGDYLREHPVRLLVGDADEFDGTYTLMRRDPALRLRHSDLVCVRQFVMTAWVYGATRADELALGLHPRLVGRETFLTDAAMKLLRAEGGMFADLVDRALPAVFDLVEVEHVLPAGGRLSGVLLRPRS